MNVAEVVEEAVEAVRLTAACKGVGLQADAAPDIRIRADATRLQIVWNLLSNAIKFTSSGGRVNISSRREGDHVVITVVDTGDGIDPKFLPYVFDRFRQADVSTMLIPGPTGPPAIPGPPVPRPPGPLAPWPP